MGKQWMENERIAKNILIGLLTSQTKLVFRLVWTFNKIISKSLDSIAKSLSPFGHLALANISDIFSCNTIETELNKREL